MAKRMEKRRPVASPPQEEPPIVNENFRADQREALGVKLLSQELGITPGQLRGLRLAHGRDMARIRAEAARLRRE